MNDDEILYFKRKLNWITDTMTNELSVDGRIPPHDYYCIYVLVQGMEEALTE